MDLLNHLSTAILASLFIGLFSLAIGCYIFNNSKKLVTEVSATIFIVSFFLMFVPLAQTDITAKATYPVKDILEIDGDTTAMLSFPVNSSLQKVYVNLGECDELTKNFSAYGYSSYLRKGASVPVLISENNVPSGIYRCTFYLCKSPYCRDIISYNERKLRID